MLKHPFLASAVARLPLVEVPPGSWCPTAATDGYHIFWCRSFFQKLTEDEIIGVLAHEVLHVVLGHLDRRGARDPSIWNQAIDHATNLILLGQRVVLPEPHLAEFSFGRMPAEEIYVRLESAPKMQNKTVTIRGRRIGRSATKSKSHSVSGPNAVEGGSDGTYGFDVHVDPSDPCISGIVGRSMPSPLELGRLRHDLMRDLRSELARSNGAGNIPGELSEAIIRAGRPRAPWQTLLARCVSGIRRDDYRLLPPSRKHIWRGIYLPSSGVPGPRLLVCGVDTSGSVGAGLAQKFLTEVHSLRSSAQCKIYVVQCDTRITKMSAYESWELPDAALGQSEFRGRGGTDFRPVFDWIQKDVIQREGAPDLVAYLTDGEGPYPDVPPPYPVVWLVPEGIRTTPPFGLKIEIF